MRLLLLFSLAFGFVLSTTNRASAQQDKGELFETEFKQLLPRGGIPAIRQPTFVSADEADIDKKSWVLGVVIDGQAKAYSLNLLNSHEIVNDRIGSTKFAAVW